MGKLSLFRRFKAVPPNIAFTFFTVCSAILVGGPSAAKILHIHRPYWISHNMLGIVYVCAVGAFLALGFFYICYLTEQEYQRKIHDPTVALKYQTIFDNRTTKHLEAAQALYEYFPNDLEDIENNKELSDIDWILDLLEDIGFYTKNGDQISPEVAHHHFYHWIRGYYSASRLYIEAWQREEPARWKHIKYLFEKTRDIECADGKSKEKEFLRAEQVKEFLEEEKTRR